MGKGRTLVKGTLLLTLSGLALRGLGLLFQSLLATRVRPRVVCRLPDGRQLWEERTQQTSECENIIEPTI